MCSWTARSHLLREGGELQHQNKGQEVPPQRPAQGVLGQKELHRQEGGGERLHRDPQQPLRERREAQEEEL
jgi:hypothetical protein